MCAAVAWGERYNSYLALDLYHTFKCEGCWVTLCNTEQQVGREVRYINNSRKNLGSHCVKQDFLAALMALSFGSCFHTTSKQEIRVNSDISFLLYWSSCSKRSHSMKSFEQVWILSINDVKLIPGSQLPINFLRLLFGIENRDLGTRNQLHHHPLIRGLNSCLFKANTIRGH